jgi:hypothetical protein
MEAEILVIQLAEGAFVDELRAGGLKSGNSIGLAEGAFADELRAGGSGAFNGGLLVLLEVYWNYKLVLPKLQTPSKDLFFTYIKRFIKKISNITYYNIFLRKLELSSL